MESTVGQPCGSLSTGNIRQIFGRIFETPSAEWYTSVDSRRLSTVELKSKAFLAVDSMPWPAAHAPVRKTPVFPVQQVCKASVRLIDAFPTSARRKGHCAQH
eukprot:1193029-Prorocentrum_minimum.AAC.1